MHIYMHSAKKAFSSLCIYLCTLFIIWCFHCVALPVTHAVLAGGAKLWWSPLQHLPVGFACDKLHLVGEVPPFDSEFTTRGSLTRMQSGTPSKLAEGDFFMQFWQGGARLQQSPLQHPPVRFTRGKLHLVREVSPFDSEFTTRRSLTRMQSGTLSKSAEGDIFRRVIVHFLKNTCLRMMECLHCELKAFSDCAYIYA